MTQQFDKDYWEARWKRNAGPDRGQEIAPNPYLAREVGALTPGTALDAGCGRGAEAIWLAARGWHVIGADISAGSWPTPPIEPWEPAWPPSASDGSRPT